VQVNPSRSDVPGVPYLALGILLKLGCRVDHARQFALQPLFGIVAVDSVALIVEFVSAALDFIVKGYIGDGICFD
jgi:hypothetical protein